MSSDSAAELDLITVALDVPERYDGWRLDHFIQARIPRLSRTRIQKMLRAQQQLAGLTLRPAQRVRGGQRIELLRPAPDEPDVPREFELLYEDEYLLAIDKPAGLPVHATARFHRNTLTALLRERYAGQTVPTLCHRIDRETSGVLLLARHHPSEIALKKDFFDRRVGKRYVAIVELAAPGALGEQSGVIDAPLGTCEESGIRIRQAVTPQGQVARTRWRVIERRGRYAMVEAKPETGRQHQIRVHLSHVGAPIVGDKLYGPDWRLMLEYLETGWTERLAERLLLPRHALHAAWLGFEHPMSKQQVQVEAPLPRELREFWEGRAE
ncbi:MAG: RluA family pseudouridine synthase [Myxococcales bacterium]|nr:RluA family pseudouridine synthase [Myxococcales bacterium]